MGSALNSLRRDVLADHGLSVLEVMSFVRRILGVDTPWSMLVDGEQQRVRLQFEGADDVEVAALAREEPRSSS